MVVGLLGAEAVQVHAAFTAALVGEEGGGRVAHALLVGGERERRVAADGALALDCFGGCAGRYGAAWGEFRLAPLVDVGLVVVGLSGPELLRVESGGCRCEEGRGQSEDGEVHCGNWILLSGLVSIWRVKLLIKRPL